MKRENKLRKIRLAKAKRELAKKEKRFVEREAVDVFSQVWEKVGSFRSMTNSAKAVHSFYELIGS